MNYKKTTGQFIGVMITPLSHAQSPFSSPEASQFDFWLGNWNLTWNDSSKGNNFIDKTMDGCTIHEHSIDPLNNFRGESWSVYNPQKKLWQQTWVDNEGGFIVLTGGMAGDEMILTTEEQKLPQVQRSQEWFSTTSKKIHSTGDGKHLMMVAIHGK